MKLTHENMTKVIKDCLFTDEEIPGMDGIKSLDDPRVPNNAVMVQAAMYKFGFHKERLESHRQDVKSMLEDLPDQFRSDLPEGGHGWSLMSMVQTKYGTLWGEQSDADTLYALAAGLGYARYVLPREMWSMLPGGMPYVVIDLQEKTDETLPAAG